MLTGKIKFWKTDKGWGFVVPDTGEPEVFLHVSGWLDKTLPVTGQSVEFKTAINKRTGKINAVEARGL